jgi:hemin uptake protein HemP
MAYVLPVKDSITKPESTHEEPISRRFFDISNAKNVQYATFYPNKSEFDAEYFKESFAIDSTTSEQVGQAKSVIEALEESGNFVDLIAPNDLVTLPIGVKTQIGTITYTLAISNAKITRDYAEVTAFVHIRIPQTDNNGEAIELFFGANNIKISHQGGIYGDANLVLLGDIGIPISGGNGLVALKGGFDMGTGNVQNRTYVTIDCGGFREMGVTADVLFPRSMLQPVDANYQVIPDENVKGSFQTIVGDWNDILVEIDLPAFQLSKTSAGDDSGKAGLIFDINTAVF